MTELGPFAEKIFKRTYAIHPEETWDECARRVADFVAEDDKELADQFYVAIRDRKFMPGGRYLAQAGKDIAQLTNCFLFRVDDSREGWSQLLYKHMMALSTGGGCGTYYGDVRGSGVPIKRFGGTASGPISLMKMVNECARHVLAGGKRRSALWAGLPWNHPDIQEFIIVKNWTTAVRALKEQDFNFPATLDMTNISVCLDDEFFSELAKNPQGPAWNLYYAVCKSMCKTGEPGFSINRGPHALEVLRNPCQPGWATVLTPDGIRTFDEIGVGSVVWGGRDWTRVTKKWSTGVKPVQRYHTTAGCFVGTENHRVVENGVKIEANLAEGIDRAIGPNCSKGLPLNAQDIMDGLVLGDGGVHKASNNLVILYIGDRDQEYHASEIKPLIQRYRPGINSKTWEVKTTITAEELPRTFKRSVPARFYKGNAQTSLGFLRGLFTANGSVCGNRVTLKQTSYVLICQVRDMLSSLGIRTYITTNNPVSIEHSNGTYISKRSYTLNITSDRDKFTRNIGFIQQYKTDTLVPKNSSRQKNTFEILSVEDCGGHEVFDIEVADSNHTYWTGGLLVSNCTEVVSDEDSDCCNLGSVNLAKIANIEELKQLTRLAVKFLYLGTYRSWLPHEDFYTVREKSRRIGVGIMGLHEWCIRNGERYEPNGELGKWLSSWASASDDEAVKFSKKMKGKRPVAVRAIAPTGTIGIIAETTTGIEPVNCVAYKRRYLGNNGIWQVEYVIAPTVKRLLDESVISNPNEIEDATKLASSVERRMRMQAFIQAFVDQGIASTINLPEWGEPGNNNATQFAKILLEYLPKLRGITVYPDKARAGQPIVPIKWETALKNQAQAKEDEDRCAGGVCGL